MYGRSVGSPPAGAASIVTSGADISVILVLASIGFIGATGTPGVGGAISYYGSFYDETTQTNLGGATGFNYFQYNYTYESNGVYVDSLDKSKIVVPSNGTYNIQF